MTTDFRRVLCPVDYSAFSRRALDHAAAIARWYDGEVMALHVHARAVPIGPAVPMPGEVAVDLGVATDESRAELERFVRPHIERGDRLRLATAAGRPSAAIHDEAQRWPADLIVLGTHGRSGFERLVLGSVTDKVLRKAACPVLTVPRAMPDDARTVPVLFERILAPVDFSDASLTALEQAMSLARESGGCLTLVHVLEAPEQEPSLSAHFDIPEYHRLMESSARERLDKLVPADAAAWCTPARRIVTGKAYHGILQAAREVQADLIVMGVLGRNAVDLLLFGSTTHHVVREATCPVLTVRPPG